MNPIQLIPVTHSVSLISMCVSMVYVCHSGLSKILIKSQTPWMGSSQGERALLGGP